jgi:hypothetical protein
MNGKKFHDSASWLWRHKVLLVLPLIPALMLGFLVVEHLRGRISLARYINRLSAEGEKMTARDFLAAPPKGENGAPEILATANELKPGAVVPNNNPPRMNLTPAGHAVVCFREEQWVEGKVTNHWAQLAADLEANTVIMERIQQAMSKPVLNCEFDPTLGARARFPHLPVPKHLAQWFSSRIALGLHEGRTRDTVKDLVVEIELPRMLALDGIIISELVRVAIAGIARADTWEALQANGWTDGDLAQVQRAWEGQRFAGPMIRALEGERIFAQSSYQHMRQSNEEAAGVLFWMDQLGSDEERPRWEEFLSNLPGGKMTAEFLKKQVYCRLWRFAWLDQDELHYLRYLERLIALAREAPRSKSFQTLQPFTDALVLEFQNRGLYDRLRYFSEMSVNALSRTLARAMRAETERSLVLAAIALRRYMLSHGSPPESLNSLVPDFLQSAPVDFMDGQPLRFRKQISGDFVLYSVGEDGKDDGGDAGLRPGKTSLRTLWERKDVVWPAPASMEEVQAYRAKRN